MEPISTTGIALGALGSALGGLGNFLGAKAQAKVEKKKVKEMKRKTFADLLNEAHTRSYDASKDLRRSQGDIAGARARALQDMAAGIRQSLIR